MVYISLVKRYKMAYIPVYEVSAQDIAMDSFRAAWSHQSGGIRVSHDGMRMTIPLPNNDKMAARAILEANSIISSHRLPLQADLIESTVNRLITRRTLTIQFDSTKAELPCY